MLNELRYSRRLLIPGMSNSPALVFSKGKKKKRKNKRLQESNLQELEEFKSPQLKLPGAKSA